jgi:hypothetical protein
VVECLPSKCEVLSSQYHQKKKKKEKKIHVRMQVNYVGSDTRLPGVKSLLGKLLAVSLWSPGIWRCKKNNNTDFSGVLGDLY